MSLKTLKIWILMPMSKILSKKNREKSSKFSDPHKFLFELFYFSYGAKFLNLLKFILIIIDFLKIIQLYNGMQTDEKRRLTKGFRCVFVRGVKSFN